MGASKQSSIFGCPLRWGLERCTGPISDSTLDALVEALDSLIVLPSSSITRGLSAVSQRESWVVARNALSALTLTATNLTRST